MTGPRKIVRRRRTPAPAAVAHAAKPEVVAAAEPEALAEPAAEKPTRRRRSSVGGQSLKLSAPQREGFVRRWVNDDKNRIAEMQDLAYDFVSETGIKTDGPGSRVSRLVGTKASGEALHAFLMETPADEFAQGVAEKASYNDLVDQAIRSGSDFSGRMDSETTYGKGSIQSG